MRTLYFVELLFDGLAELQVVDVLEDELTLDNLAELFEGAVERVLLRVRIQSFEKLRRGRVLELDGSDEPRSSQCSVTIAVSM